MLFLFIFIIAGLGYEYYISQFHLQTSASSISSQKFTKPLRIVQLTDLHNSEFSPNNIELVDQVLAQSPDLIFITGDVINTDEEELGIATHLIEEMVSIAPTYISLGNHEKEYEDKYGTDIVSLYSSVGATVLERNYIDTTINDQSIRIGGIYGYCQPVVHAIETHREDETDFLLDFQNTDAYMILLCHMPVCWLESGSLYEYDIDCVFSGHAHGGQVRIPFIGGLWAPDQGWFPGAEAGIYETNEENWIKHRENMLKWAKEQKYDTSYYEQDKEYQPSYLVLSRGLGNTDWLPRFNNIPEIVVVDFIPQE